MRCTFKTVFYVNGSKERNGIVPIMGRVTSTKLDHDISVFESRIKGHLPVMGGMA